LTTHKTNREDRVQRIRVGLTGLAFVLLAAAVGNAILTTLSVPEVTTASQKSAKADAASGDEPLVELGVVPGNPDSNAVEQAAPAGRKTATTPAQAK
jgi:hypothetical protein